MGYVVYLNSDDRELCKRATEDLAAVFGRPYVGYLLFLVGSPDVTALDWLRRHVDALDSLTRDLVGFAVFAEKMVLNLHAEETGIAQIGRRSCPGPRGWGVPSDLGCFRRSA